MTPLRLAALGLASLLTATAPAHETADHPDHKFEEGQHYTVLENIPPAEVPEGKTELIEFFWYGDARTATGWSRCSSLGLKSEPIRFTCGSSRPSSVRDGWWVPGCTTPWN